MSRNLRFLHLADTHLGMEFQGQRSKDPEFYEHLRMATYRAFDRVVAHALEREVDFLCIAGDVYHRIHDNLRAQAYFSRAAQGLAEAGIQIYVVGGNHDPLSDRILKQPENVHILSSEEVERIAVPAQGERPSYAIYGRSYAKAEENSNFARAYARELHDENAIALLHTNVGSSGAGERYARAEIDDLLAADMDYWALGHIHLETILSSERPYIIYPGSTQALHINEQGRHGCYYVEMKSGRVEELLWLPTGVVDFAQIELDISEIEDASRLAFDLHELLSPKLDDLIAHKSQLGLSEYLLRLKLVGTRQFKESITTVELIDELKELLSGSYPKKVLLDDALIDETRADLSAHMEGESNPLLRMIFDYAPDDLSFERVFDDMLSSNRREFHDIVAEELDAQHEQLLAQAKELLYTRLRKEVS